MSDPPPWKYRAFLSYSHKDRAAAWLWRWRLERFRIDVRLIGQATPLGPVPHALSPIFHDRQDFPAGGELTAMTRAALDGSAALILLASPAAAVSTYVNEEVRWFRWKYPYRPVVAIILKGQPGDPDKECFPPAYRFAIAEDGAILDTPVDVIAADPRRHGDGRARAQAKVVAGMTGLTVGQVLSRVTDAIRRERAWMFGGLGVAVAAMAALVVWSSLHTGKKLDTIAATTQTTQTGVQTLVAGQPEIMAALARIERIQAETKIAETGGQAALEAMKRIRDLLRPDIPNIDRVQDEKLAAEVERILTDAKKPPPPQENFDANISRALKDARDRIGVLALADARKGLDAARAMAKAEGEKVARGAAALAAETGRVSRLQLAYREAAGFYDEAARLLSFDPQAAFPHAIAAADALFAQGEEFGDNQALTAAIERSHAILAQTNRQTAPAAWAAAQYRLGKALTRLGERDPGPSLLDQAAAAYRLAAEASPRATAPDAWANAQLGLGAALQTLGQRESGTARLEEAVAAYRLALTEWTQARVPLDWAATQNNLGAALQTLGQRESGTARLEDAVAAFRLALTEWTQARVPLNWASTRYNMGFAWEALADRTGDRATLLSAIEATKEAASVFRDGGNSYALPMAEQRIAELEAKLAAMK